MKTEEIIRNYIMRTLSIHSFTWTIDIIEHGIWGFKNAPYKNFIRAKNKVNLVIEKMKEEGIINVNFDNHDNFTITMGKNFSEHNIYTIVEK